MIFHVSADEEFVGHKTDSDWETKFKDCYIVLTEF